MAAESIYVKPAFPRIRCGKRQLLGRQEFVGIKLAAATGDRASTESMLWCTRERTSGCCVLLEAQRT